MLDEGASYNEIKEKLDTTAPTISLWKKRYREEGLLGLASGCWLVSVARGDASVSKHAWECGCFARFALNNGMRLSEPKRLAVAVGYTGGVCGWVAANSLATENSAGRGRPSDRIRLVSG